VSDLQRRCAEAEARQQEAAARIPEATHPLMRQLESMQAAAAEQGAAWREAERGLQARLRASEAVAGGAAGQAAHLARELDEARQQLAAATEQVGGWVVEGQGEAACGVMHRQLRAPGQLRCALDLDHAPPALPPIAAAVDGALGAV
jgi:hypothetical protein